MAKQYFVNKYLSGEIARTGKILGQGSYAVVCHAIHSGTEIAIKFPKNAVGRCHIFNEINILSRISHENVIKLIGVIGEDFHSHPKLLMEYLRNGSLAGFVQKQHHQLNQVQLFKLLLDICKGMTYLHDMNVIHRDIACRNVLVNCFQTAKVADFGFSVQVECINSTDNNECFEFTTDEISRIPYRHMPMEAIQGLRRGSKTKGVYSKSVDVYSFGVLIWEVLVPGLQPYAESGLGPKEDVVEAIHYGKNPSCFGEIRTNHIILGELMNAIFELGPRQRPTFSNLRYIIEERIKLLDSLEESFNKVLHFGQTLAYKCPKPVQHLNSDVLFTTSNSADSGYTGSSTSDSCLADEEIQAVDMDIAIVLQNVTPLLPDSDFAAGVLKKFGRPDLMRVYAVKRLSSKSLAIGIESSKPANRIKIKSKSNKSFQTRLTEMVQKMKQSADVWQNGVRVTSIFKGDSRDQNLI